MFLPGIRYAVSRVIESAIIPPINADIDTTGVKEEIATMAKAAPALAPDATPTTSGEARGFLKII